MNEKYLVINAGSSSVKFKLFDMPSKEIVSSGTIERIGKEGCCWKIKYNGNEFKDKGNLSNHVEAVEVILKTLLEKGVIADLNEIKGVGHRVLHGSTFFKESVINDNNVLEKLEQIKELGPLHMPPAIAVIKCMNCLLPGVSQVASFDTAFHQSIPKENYKFAVPDSYYEKGVRRYGFHGISYLYVTKKMQKLLQKENVNLIIAQSGSGVSLVAVKDGKSYNTSMGLTPIDGSIMGTRCGSIDVSIIEYMMKKGKTLDEIMKELNEKSGLYGITGMNDYRDIEEAAANCNEKAKLGIDMFVKSIAKIIMGYWGVDLESKIDAIVFTAGIGENSSTFREDVINKIKNAMGIILDEDMNNKIASFKEKQSGIITTCDSKIPVYVIPTNEELMILEDTYRIVNELNKGKAKVKNR